MPKIQELQELKFQLEQLLKLFKSLKEEDTSLYSKKIELLGNQSIGAHVRHTIEFIQLYHNTTVSEINYGARSRNSELEQDLEIAIHQTEEFLSNLSVNSDLEYHISESGAKQETSAERELIFLADHSIHHMAIIGIAIKQLGYSHLLPKYFGIAPSTIKHLEKQAS